MGELEFKAAGQIWALAPMDILVMPENMPYIYTNVGLSEVVFFDTRGRVKPGAKTIYYESDPGWPARSGRPYSPCRSEEYIGAKTRMSLEP